MKQQTVLKSTGQEVFPIGWNAQAPCPWDKGTHTRVLRPFVGVEGCKSSDTGETLIVRHSSIKVVK